MKRLREWYAHPDREIVRREVVWFLRWLRSPGVLSLLAFVTFFPSIAYRLYIIAGMPPWNATVILAIPQIVVLAVATYVVDKRTMAPLRGARLRDLILTDISPHMLWPGLLVAPVGFVLVSSLASLLFRTVRFILFNDNAPPETAGPHLGGWDMKPVSLIVIVMGWIWNAWLPSLLGIIAHAFGLITTAACLALPKGGLGRTALCVFGTEVLFALVFLAPLFSLLYIWPPGGNFYIGAAVSGVLWSIVSVVGYRRLKSERTWNGLRDHAMKLSEAAIQSPSRSIR